MKRNNATLLLEMWLKSENIKFKKEYKFDKSRKWRFDFAIIEKKIAIEIEGGIFTKGRHVSPKGFLNDIEKYNSATAKGWRLFRLPAHDLFNAKYFRYFEEVLNGKEKK